LKMFLPSSDTRRSFCSVRYAMCVALCDSAVPRFLVCVCVSITVWWVPLCCSLHTLRTISGPWGSRRTSMVTSVTLVMRREQTGGVHRHWWWDSALCVWDEGFSSTVPFLIRDSSLITSNAHLNLFRYSLFVVGLTLCMQQTVDLTTSVCPCATSSATLNGSVLVWPKCSPSLETSYLKM
jgi:hypothetical protein